MEVRDNPKKYYKEEREVLYNELNDAVTIAAEQAGITAEEAYAFIISFGEVKDRKELISDKDNIIKHLNNIIEAYKVQLHEVDTTNEDSIGTHKFIAGKIAGIKDAINTLQKYHNWATNDDIV